MTEKEKNKPEDFWSGFAFGASIAATLAYFLGTKVGRKYARNLLDFSEDLEGNVKNLIKSLNVEENSFGDEIKKFAKQNLSEVINKLKSKS
ncbi:MAG: hypothetical protein WEC80_01450 [Patescibacteria group bacterium]